MDAKEQEVLVEDMAYAIYKAHREHGLNHDEYAKAALLLKYAPENYRWHEEKQEALFVLMGEKRPTIRKYNNGNLEYLSLKEFRESIEAGMQPELFEEGQCACF